MYKRVHFIALVPNHHPDSENHTLYLFDKNEKVVMPVEIKNREAVFYLTGKTHLRHPVPHLYNTIKRLLSCFNVRLVSVTVYNFQDGILYTYLNLIFDQKHLEINISFHDAFVLAMMYKSPLYIKNNILEEKGIKVSKQKLRDALREGS